MTRGINIWPLITIKFLFQKLILFGLMNNPYNKSSEPANVLVSGEDNTPLSDGRYIVSTFAKFGHVIVVLHLVACGLLS